MGGSFSGTLTMCSRTVRVGPGFTGTCRRQKHVGLLGKSGSKSIRSVGGTVRLTPRGRVGVDNRCRGCRGVAGGIPFWGQGVSVHFVICLCAGWTGGA